MKVKRRLLWIEDCARYDLMELAGPLFMSDKYDLVVSENVSDGVRQLLRTEFAAVVADIRLPPGDDPDWMYLYKQGGANQVSARLGRHLLHTMLDSPDATIKLPRPLAWLIPAKVGVLSVESRSELEPDLGRLRIAHYQQKGAGIAATTLVNLFEAILSRNESGER